MSISSVINVMAIPLLISGWLVFLYMMYQDEEAEEFVDYYLYLHTLLYIFYIPTLLHIIQLPKKKNL